MANVLIAAFAVSLILLSSMTLTNAALSSASDISLSWEQMSDRNGDQARTELTLIEADINGSGTDVDTSIRNTGQTSLADFDDWDVMLSYYETGGNADLKIDWLTYKTSTPATLEWTIEGIYSDVSGLVAEKYEPNVFNPGEEMILRLNVTPEIPISTDNVIRVGVENGVSLSAPFSR